MGGVEPSGPRFRNYHILYQWVCGVISLYFEPPDLKNVNSIYVFITPNTYFTKP